MKLRLLTLYLIVLLLVLGMWAHANPLKLVTGEGYSGFSKEEDVSQKMVIEIVTLTFKIMNQEIKIEYLPWKRGLISTANHQYWGAFPYIKTKGLEADYLFSAPIYEVDIVAYFHKDNPVEIQDWKALKGMTVCSPHDWSMGNTIQDLIDRQWIYHQITDSMRNCFRLIEKKRADFFIMNRINTVGFIQHYYNDEEVFKAAKVSLEKNALYIVVSKSYPGGKALLNKFNESLSVFKKTDQYKSILKKHLDQSTLGGL